MIFVVVAHPDDEALWCGGLLLRLADAAVPIAILCLTNGGDAVRSQEFRAACKMLNAQAYMLDCPDGGNVPLPDFSADLDLLAYKFVQSGAKIEMLLTHPPHGNERGHPQHRQCYLIVRNWASGKGISFGVFSERPLAKLIVSLGSTNSSAVVSSTVRWSFFDRIVTGLRALRRSKFNPRAAVEMWARAKERGFFGARSMLTISVDGNRKRKLCEQHPSQMAGIEQYATLTKPFEYIYFDSSKAAQVLMAALKAY